uniref:Dynein light chain n=1 Tax=Anopheles melas TaxID=34690 RepID=A0A182TNM9_9DIPT
MTLNETQTGNVPPSPAGYQMRPELRQTYSAADASRWTKSMADEISLQVKDLQMHHYKHVVQVWLGQQLGAGCKCVARCRWDTECDNYATAEFKNSTMFCVVTVYGLYLY